MFCKEMILQCTKRYAAKQFYFFTRAYLLHTSTHCNVNIICLRLWQRSQSSLISLVFFGTFGAVALKRLASLPRPSQVMSPETSECGQSYSPAQGYCFPQVFLFKSRTHTCRCVKRLGGHTYYYKSHYPVC